VNRCATQQHIVQAFVFPTLPRTEGKPAMSEGEGMTTCQQISRLETLDGLRQSESLSKGHRRAEKGILNP